MSAGSARGVLDRLGSWGASAPARVAAWLALAGVTGLLVRGEVLRPERPEGVRVVADLVYRETGGRRVRLDVLAPIGPAPPGGRPALVALHGGGWRGGGKGDYGRSLAPLVRRGLVVVAVDYRLSRPGTPSWPENLDDVRDAVRWVHRHAGEYGIDPDRVGLIGASAGAHLALLAAFSPDDGPPAVRAVVDFYGPTDLAALAASRTAADGALGLFLGGTPSAYPGRYEAASPLPKVRPGVPPVFLAHGADDALVPTGQSRALAAALERAGVAHRLLVVDGARHGFGLRAGDRDLIPDIIEFLTRVWGDWPGAARPGAECPPGPVASSFRDAPGSPAFPGGGA